MGISIIGGSGEGIPSGQTADRPANPSIGDQFYNGTLGVLEIYTASGWLPATGANDFNLILTGSETAITLDKDYFSGAYTITSSLVDTSLDVYVFDAANVLVGYTNTASINATSNFKKIVVYGGTNGDLLSFEYKTTFTSAASTADTFAAPYITSISAASLPNINNTTTITGGNFDTDVQVWFDGANSYSQQAKSVVYGSSTSIVATRPDNLIQDNAPYTIRVVNPGITSPTGSNKHRLVNAITVGADPVWVTSSGFLPGYTVNSPYSTTLQATDADGGTVTYTLQSGSLPTGISLNGSTGVLSGTPTAQEVRTFTIRATDSGGNTADRQFSLSIPFLAEYVVVAGGGGGGGGYTDGAGGVAGGGGGAGGYRSSVVGESSGGGASAESRLTISVGASYTATVGAGGAGIADGYAIANKGSNSVFGSVTSIGGGAGWTRFATPQDSGNGGSGGGGSMDNNGNVGGNGTSGQGYGGGTAGSRAGAGGGGAGAIGGNFVSATNSGGPGGNGVSSSITGTAVTRAGGGGGAGGNNSGTRLGGAGGAGGGGQGSTGTGTGGVTAGTINTGGGGGAGAGGTSGSVASAAGGSGVVILRYSDILTLTLGAGLTGSTSSPSGGFKVTTITAGTGNVSWAA